MFGQHSVVPPITLEELERITAEFTGENNMQEQEFKVGQVYKCGGGYVRIVADLSGDDKHPGLFSLVGIECNEDGETTNCYTGMFSNLSGEYYCLNPEVLYHVLEPLEQEPQTTELTLQ